VFTVPTAHAVADHLGLTCPFADLVTLPRDIELAVRRRADGASEVLFKILGPAGAHTRTSVGVFQLPKNATVELSMVATADDR